MPMKSSGSMEDYVNIHTEKETYLVLQSLSHLESRLDPDIFIRMHRSHIVNMKAIAVMLPWTNGRFKCRLKNGCEIVTSRSGAKKLKTMLM